MDALVSKLAHPLRDVRVRALKSLLFKLENGLVAARDVVEYDAVFVQLLEWFNYDDCTCEEEALRLIENLAKEAAGAAGFVRVGGILFFEEYRASAPADLRSRVDAIHALLLKSPASGFAPEQARRRPPADVDTAPSSALAAAIEASRPSPPASAQLQQDSLRASASALAAAMGTARPSLPASGQLAYDSLRTPSSALAAAIDASRPSPPASAKLASDRLHAVDVKLSASLPRLPSAGPSFPALDSGIVPRKDIYEVLAATGPKYDPRFVERTVGRRPDRHGALSELEGERGGSRDRLVYPHVHTTRADDQWLLEWEVRLKMTDPALVADSLAALRVHVLPALPAELLLQPCGVDLLAAILATLRTGGSSSAGTEAAAAVRTEALHCVEAAARGWAASLRFLCEPAYRLPAREGEGPRDATAGAAEELHYPSVRRTASARAISGKRIVERPVADLLARPVAPGEGEPAMGLETAAHLCLTTVLPFLRHASLLPPALSALRALLPFAAPRLRGLAGACDEKEAAADAGRVRDYLAAAAEAIGAHAGGDGTAAVAGEPLLVPAVQWTLELLTALPERWQPDAAPSDLLKLYAALAADEYAAAARPQLRAALLPVLRRLDPASVSEMDYGLRVLAAARDSGALEGVAAPWPLERARECLHGLQYRPERALPVIDALFRSAAAAHAEAPTEAAEALLVALAFPHPRVRAAAYCRLRAALLEDGAAAGLWEAACGGDVLLHLLARGLDEPEPAAAAAAAALLAAAADRLDAAGRMGTVLGPLGAWLLARAAPEATEADDVEGRAVLPGPFGRLARSLEARLAAPDRLRHLLRALYSAAEWVRREASEKVRLAEPAALDFLDALDGNDRVRLGRRLRDPFGSLLDPGPADDLEPPGSPLPGSFQASELGKVQRIYQSGALEPAIRKAAAEQLALAMRDPRFHAAFADESLIRTALADLRAAAAAARGGERGGLENPAAALLASLCRLLPEARRAVRDDLDTLRALIPFVYHPHFAVRRELSCALAWALFGEDDMRGRACRAPALYAREALEEPDPERICLPAPLAAGFRFAFPIRPCPLRGPLDAAVPPARPLVARTLAAAWHLQRVGGLSAALRSLAEGGGASLTAEERDGLLEMARLHAPTAVRAAIDAAASAACHADCSAALARLAALVEADPAAARCFATATWPDTFRRFLTLAPSTAADDELLAALLRLLSLLGEPAPPPKARLVLSAASETLVPLLQPGRPHPAAAASYDSARARHAAVSAAQGAREGLQLAALVFLRRLAASAAPRGEPAPAAALLNDSPLAAALADGFLAPTPSPAAAPAAARARAAELLSALAAGAPWRADRWWASAPAVLRGALALLDRDVPAHGDAFRDKHLARAALATLAATLAAAPARDAASRSPGALVAESCGAALGAALAYVTDREARVRALAGAIVAQLARWPALWSALDAACPASAEDEAAAAGPAWLRAAAGRAGDVRECAAVRQEALAAVGNFVAASSAASDQTTEQLHAALDAAPFLEICLDVLRDEASTPGLCRAAAALLSTLLLAEHRPTADALFAPEAAAARWAPAAALLLRATHERRLAAAHQRAAVTPLVRDTALARLQPWAGPAASAAAELRGLRAALGQLADEAVRRGGTALRTALAQRTALLASAAEAMGEPECGAEARAALAALAANLLHRCPEARAALADAGPAAVAALLRGASASLEGKPGKGQLAACGLLTTLTARAEAAMRGALDGPEAGGAEGAAVGARLGAQLVRLYGASRSAVEGGAPDRGELRGRAAIAGALVNVLAASEAATRAALDAGLHATLIGAAEAAHGVAQTVATGGEWGAEGALRQGAAVAELVLALALLKNLAAGSEDAKRACVAARAVPLLERLWPLAAREGEALQVEMLGFVANLAARCPDACRALLAHSSTSSARPNPAAPSVAALLLQLAGRARLGPEAHRVAFAALGSMALEPLFRALLARTTFLADCGALLTRLARERTPRVVVLGPAGEASSQSSVSAAGGEGPALVAARQAAVLHFLANLAFSHEGQLAIVRTQGLVAHAVELLEDRRGPGAAGRASARAAAALLLRNLAFLQEAKPHILAAEMALPRLLAMLQGPSARLCALAASALWALVYNNQKAKVTLKAAGVARALLAREAELVQRQAALGPKGEQEGEEAGDVEAALESISVLIDLLDGRLAAA